MGPMHAPTKTIAGGSGKHLILLRIIEILDVEPALFLAKRRLRQRALAIGLERPKIMFEAGDQSDMARGRRRLAQTVQQIADHRAIDADILRFALLT